jgi:hypothetical protein
VRLQKDGGRSWIPDDSVTIISLPDFYRANVPAAVALVPGELGPFDFEFPGFGELVGLLVLPADGLEVTLASLSVEVRDVKETALASDGRGVVDHLRQPFAVPCLEMFGRGFRPYKLARKYTPNDKWRFSVKNSSAAIIRIATLALYTRTKRTP